MAITDKSNRTVQGLWIGSELSAMERMSINSFLYHGDGYHLYVYDDVKRVSKGAVIKDGNESCRNQEFSYTRTMRPIWGFSNFFRYKLLLDKGGWWADTDLICLKPFDFEEEHVFASESIRDEVLITSGVIGKRLPAAGQCSMPGKSARLKSAATGVGRDRTAIDGRNRQEVLTRSQREAVCRLLSVERARLAPSARTGRRLDVRRNDTCRPPMERSMAANRTR